MKHKSAPALGTVACTCAVLCLTSLLLAACGDLRDGTLSIELQTGCRPSIGELQVVIDMYCISIEEPGGPVLDGPNCSATLTGVELRVDETGSAVVVVVEGFEQTADQKHQVVVRGRSAPVRLVSGIDESIVVPVSPVGAFGVLALDEPGCQALPYPMTHHSATVFESGHVIVVGSGRLDASPGQTAVLVDSHTLTVDLLNTPESLHRAYHRAALLGDSRLLIVGGIDSTTGGATPELAVLRGAGPMSRAYDLGQDYLGPLRFEPLARSLVHPRARPNATVFYDDQVLINDGDNPAEMFMGESETSDLLEISNGQAFPLNGRTVTATPYGEYQALLASTTPGRVGRLTVANGDRDSIFQGYNLSVSARDRPIGLTLPNGRVMILGNRVAALEPDTSVIVLDPEALDGNNDDQDSLSLVAAPADFPVRGFTATLLDDGRVLVVGGETAAGTAASTFFVVPVEGDRRYEIEDGPFLNLPRRDHSASALPDGRVLVIGGNPAGGALHDPSLSAEVIGF